MNNFCSPHVYQIAVLFIASYILLYFLGAIFIRDSRLRNVSTACVRFARALSSGVLVVLLSLPVIPFAPSTGLRGSTVQFLPGEAGARQQIQMIGAYPACLRYTSRDIMRNGEHITVFYYNLTSSVGGIIVAELSPGRYPQQWFYDLCQGKRDFPPRTAEVYLMPSNLRRIHGLCDDSFDAARDEGTLVWTGRI